MKRFLFSVLTLLAFAANAAAMGSRARQTLDAMFDATGYVGWPSYASDPFTCNSTHTPSLTKPAIHYWNTTSGVAKYCDGTAWRVVAAEGAISSSLVPSAASLDLGSTTKPFRNLYLYGTGTFATTYLKFTGVPTGTRTITFPDATDTVATLGQAETITGIKTFSAAPVATTGIDLGSTTKPFRDLFLFGGGTYATTYLRLTGTPTGTRVVTFPDATDTVAELGQAQTFTAAQTFSAAIVQNASLQGNMATFALTSGGAAVTFVKVTIPSNSAANLLIHYVFEASTATPHVQAFGGIIGVNAVNVGGAITCVMGAPTTATQPALATDSGTLTNAITCADAGSGVLNVLATDTSSITPTTNRIRYRVEVLAATTLVVTPQ